MPVIAEKTEFEAKPVVTEVKTVDSVEATPVTEAIKPNWFDQIKNSIKERPELAIAFLASTSLAFS